jgi:hypothetical protein
MTALAKLVDAAKPTFDGYQGIADAVGISFSALLRGMKHQHVLSVETLLRLADVIGQRPDVVLRAAGRADVADLLTRLYGRPARPLDQVDRQLVALPTAKKRAALALAK